MWHPIKHFMTVARHRRAVRKLCFKCGIPCLGLTHDLSKYSPAEFIPGARYWLGTMSPQVREREEEGYSRAWMHHRGRNKHHFEFWFDYIPGIGERPVEMPPVYFAEMFCDRVGANKVYAGEAYTDSAPIEYYRRNEGHYVMHENTRRDLEKVLNMLVEKGEDETCRYIREEIVAKARKRK